MSEPISEVYRARMNAVAQVLDETFNGDAKGADRKIGFVLLVFPFGTTEIQRTNYISNGADHADMVALFREMAARFDGQPKTSTAIAWPSCITASRRP